MPPPRIDTRKCPADFGSYTEIFEDNGWIYNSNRSRARPTLVLGPSPCAQKTGHAFMPLITGRRLRRKKRTELPMPSWVMDRVHFMGQKQGQIWMPGRAPVVAMDR